MELFKKEASQLKLQNLELRETLNNKFRRTTKKEEEGEIQLPPMPVRFGSLSSLQALIRVSR